MVKISQKLYILRELTEYLETISKATGYLHDLQGQVFRGRMIFGSETETPFLSLMEAPRQIDPNGGGGQTKSVQNETWTILIQGVADNDTNNPLDPAYNLLADVQAAFGKLIATQPNTGDPVHPELYMLGDLLVDLSFQIPIVRPPEREVSDTAFFYFPFTLRVVTDLADPYYEEE